ncbi:MAG: GGDEF domain-containing protein [Ruminococcus sp.]|nr:GGDEF domain-containing protein [Ruminococcus sp.]
MKFLNRLKEIFLYEMTIDDPSHKIRTQVRKDNCKFALVWSIAQIFYWGFCTFMSFRVYRFTLCRNIYIAAFILSLITLILALILVPRFPRLMAFTKVLTCATIMGGGLLIAWVLLQHNINTIMIFASVLLIPTLFVSNTLTSIIMILVDIIAAFILMRHGLDHQVYVQCLSDMTIFATIGITLGHFVNKARFERYVFSESAVQLAELQTRYAYYDQMTGFKNRRAYSELIEEYENNMPGYCFAIMMDIDGLKSTNDILGHEAGDELIVGATECISSGFNNIETAYRLGGDEFCVIVTDKDIDVEECLSKVKTECAKWQGKYIHGISLSYGCASTEEFSDINLILNNADKRMYEAKSRYYASSGQ